MIEKVSYELKLAVVIGLGFALGVSLLDIQLSMISSQRWVSSGYILRSMLQEAVSVILQQKLNFNSPLMNIS